MTREAVRLALQEVSKRLAFNVAAYGVAWNGEHEDTEFVCQPLVAEVERLIGEAEQEASA